ncbi:MAG: hypothetical protein R2932_33130 [Caldilineaceae bacterium]
MHFPESRTRPISDSRRTNAITKNEDASHDADAERNTSHKQSIQDPVWGTHSLFSQLVQRVAADTPIQSVLIATPEAQLAGDAMPIHRLTPQAEPVNTDELPLTNQFIQKTTLHVAWQLGLPTYGVQRIGAPEVVAFLREMAPDLICVACFPWRISPNFWSSQPMALSICIHRCCQIFGDRRHSFGNCAPVYKPAA